MEKEPQEQQEFFFCFIYVSDPVELVRQKVRFFGCESDIGVFELLLLAGFISLFLGFSFIMVLLFFPFSQQPNRAKWLNFSLLVFFY